jgi:4-hydroxybenzoate polyprenyltransferase
MGKVRNYLSLIKFSHTIFAMPFAMIGFFLGLLSAGMVGKSILAANRTSTGLDNWEDSALIKFLFVVACMVFARSAAMAFNRYLDRKYDAKNPRTSIREIPSGVISAGNALWFTIVSCALFIVATYFINELCFYLSPVALLVILGYSYTKRFTPLCHLILGLGLSLAPIGAYLAVTGTFDWLPLFFSIAVLFWVSGFDIIYALQDEEFDRSQQLYSIPAWLGKKRALKVSELLHLLSITAVSGAGVYANRVVHLDFGWLYWLGVAVFSGMIFYQHSIVSADDLRRVDRAFMTANGIASVVYAGLVIAEILL